MTALHLGAPLTPDGDEAREWAERELSNPAYAEAQPNVIDRFAGEVVRFITRLFMGGEGGSFPWIPVIVGVLVAVLIVVAFLVWGRPRALVRNRRTGDLFGDTDQRNAAQLREDAQAHANKNEWDAAIIVRFRALARGLHERAVLDTNPGTTVHTFAREAGMLFPASKSELDAVAGIFDDVRYLRRPGTSELFARVTALDDDLVVSLPDSHSDQVLL